MHSEKERIWILSLRECPSNEQTRRDQQKLFCSGGCTLQTTLRQWEVHFIVSLSHDPDYLDHQYPVRLYGETVDQLQQKVRAYLKKHRPSYFANFGDHIVGEESYVCSNGKMRPPFEWRLDPARFDEFRGWWHYSRRYVSGRPQRDDTTPIPFPIGNLEDAVEDFVNTALIPRKGPDYRPQAMDEHQLQLPLLESVLREAEEFTLNDLLLRGWQLLAVEYHGEVSRTGELTNRQASFVLGHADWPAAYYTLKRRDAYYQIHVLVTEQKYKK